MPKWNFKSFEDLEKNKVMWYFVRHGEIESNIKKVYAGWSEEGLTTRGIQQARNAGQELINYEIDCIYCSPLRRTVQTADIIGDALRKQPLLEESFKELRMGPWEGLSEDTIAREHPAEWELWNSRPADLILHGRETLSELQARVLEGLAKIRKKHFVKSFLIVSHVAIIRVLLLYSLRMDLNFYKTLSVPNGQVFGIDDELVK